ncbi:MAG: ATP-binding protein [Oleiphilus sp.]|nr:MAG: ATP-binding protein [Oleiphilus sp.]
MSTHLHIGVEKLTDSSDEQRIAHIQKKHWIGYTRANEIIRAMEDLYSHPQVHRMPNMLIKSETNNGKSSILHRFAKLHPPFEDHQDERIKTPVLFLEINPDPSPDALYALILQGLYIGYKESYSKEIKAKKAFEAILHHGVKMLLIDELHVLMNTTKLRKAQMLDTLKYISNRAQIPIVGAGTIEAHTAILSDSQLANRFKPYKLPAWKLDSAFQKLVLSFEKILPLKQPSQLGSQELTTELFAMSGGWIGELSEVLQLASIKAIKTREEKITLKILRDLTWQTPEQRRIT